MKKNITLRLLATVGLGGVLYVNALAVFQPLNGLTTKQVADLYPTLFTPAGITFSIWSLIYLSLIGFLVRAWRRPDSLLIEQILPWFILSCVLNMAWIVAWHFLLPFVSVVIMIGLLATLICIFRIIQTDLSIDQFEAVFVVFPFRLYLAWICVATIANIAALLVHWNLAGGRIAQELWTIAMMAIATALSLLFVKRYKAWSFGVVVLWALFGICLRWESGQHPYIVVAGIFLMVSLCSYTIYSVVYGKKTWRTKPIRDASIRQADDGE